MRKTKRHGVVVPNKAGWRPREEFLLELRRRHPRIRIVWADGINEWLAMQQTQGGDMHLVFGCGRRFGEQWLRSKLRACRVSKGNVDALIRRIDASNAMQEAAVAAGASQKYQEGSDRLYSEFTKRSRVAFSGIPRNRSDRKRR